MVLKTKLSLGLGFLFAIIFVLAFFCSYYVEKLSDDAQTILRDNYDSLVYSRNMIAALDDMRTAIDSGIFNPAGDKKIANYYLQLFDSGKAEFEKNLKAEKNNITEIHEKEYVDTLSSTYAIYLNLCEQVRKGTGSNSMYYSEILPCYEKLKQAINNIYDINMQAVVRKSDATRHLAANVKIYISVIATLCIILAFGYFWYFQFYISNTISYLSNRITALLEKAGIACEIKTDDEAYIILQAIRRLEKKLGVEGSKDDNL